MKLAFTLFTWFPHGSLTRDLIAIARVCQQRGHRVKVYARECNGVVDDDMDLQLVPSKAQTNHGKNHGFADRVRTAMVEFAPDLVVGFNKMPHLDVYYAADDCFAENNKKRGRLYRMQPRDRNSTNYEGAVFSRNSSTRILLIARGQMDAFHNFYGTPKDRMRLLPPGISRDRVAGTDAPARRAEFRAEWRIGKDDLVVVMIGSDFHRKGLRRALRAFASLPSHLLESAHFFAIGRDRTAQYQTLAQELGVDSKVRFTGSRDDVPEFLLGADLLVHPAYRENTGAVLLEAMVAGLPVIATDVCGYAHYIEEQGMGEVVAGSPFDQPVMDRAVQRVLNVERDAWRTRGRAFAEQADIYDMPMHACREIEEVGSANRTPQNTVRKSP